MLVQPGSANRTPVSIPPNGSASFDFVVPTGTANNGAFNISSVGGGMLSSWNVLDSNGNQITPGGGGGMVPGVNFVYFTSNNSMPQFAPTLTPGKYTVNVTASDAGYNGTAESIPPQVPGGGGHPRR